MSQLIQYCTRASLYDGPFGDGAPWPAAGMGYIFVTETNRLILLDGGHGEDAEPLLELLRETAGGHPTVDLWILTHPHMDHYGALRQIAAEESLRSRVTVKEIAWYFPAAFRDAKGRAPCERANRHMEEITAALGAVAHTPFMGETLFLDELRLVMLFVPVDCEGLDNPNSLSLIMRVESPRKAVLMTGDAFPVTLRYCEEAYGEGLACDVLQMPHHGLCDTGRIPFYRYAHARTLLVPISRAGDRVMRSGIYGEATAANLAAEEQAEEIYRAFEGTVAIPL